METQHKKKVLFLITKSNWGGAQRYVYDLATNVDKNLFEPVVALGGSGQLVDMLHNAGIRTITIGSLGRDIAVKKEWLFAKELWHILRAEQPDVFHVNSSKAGGVGALLGRLTRTPRVIFTAHGWAFNEDRPYWQRVIIKYLHWLTVFLAHKTITVSSAMVSQMNWPGVQSKMKVINPGRTIGPMYTKDEAREKIVGFYPTLAPLLADQWLVCIAELHPIKRHKVLIESMSALTKAYPTLRLICIGDGQEQKNLEEQIMLHNLRHHVFLVGSIIEAARFLKGFDMFVLASKSESYGYVLHEAGLAGIPVVATNVGGIPDIIDHNKTGLLVSPDSVTELTTAIDTMLTNPKLSSELSANLQTELSSRTVAKMVTQTTAIYIM